MNRCLSVLGLLTGLLLLLPLPVAADEDPDIQFGFYPSHNRDQLLILADEFCEYISKKAKVKVKPFVSVGYDDLVEEITANNVHFAWMSPLSFVQAEKKGNARVLLKSVRGSNPFYWGAVIVRKGRNIETLEDLKGKKMGWTYPSSTAGFIFTKAALHAEGINADTYFSENLFLGGYDELVKAVVESKVDAGACFANDIDGKRGAWSQYLSAADRRKIKPIFFTKPIPGDTISGSKIFINANPKVTNRILQVLLDMGEDEKGAQILTDLYQVDFLVDAENDDYESVREAALLFPDRY